MSTSTATKQTEGNTKVRHIRIPDPIWDGAGEQAVSDGYTLSQVTRSLLDAYRNGDIRLTATMVKGR